MIDLDFLHGKIDILHNGAYATTLEYRKLSVEHSQGKAGSNKESQTLNLFLTHNEARIHSISINKILRFKYEIIATKKHRKYERRK
jgi:hypothetical protein